MLQSLLSHIKTVLANSAYAPVSNASLCPSGPSCTGAVLVSLSATKGANIFRVKRDDEVSDSHMLYLWGYHQTSLITCSFLCSIIPQHSSPCFFLLQYIMRMMTWIKKFYVTYVLSSKKNIPENYFLKEAGYHDLLNATLRICSDAVLVAHVPDCDVQRSPLNTNFFI
jgi:hypothetical protein